MHRSLLTYLLRQCGCGRVGFRTTDQDEGKLYKGTNFPSMGRLVCNHIKLSRNQCVAPLGRNFRGAMALVVHVVSPPLVT